MSFPRHIETIRLPGLTPYPDAIALMRERRLALEAGRATNALFLLEHSPVITRGRRSDDAHLLHTPDHLRALGIALHDADRGGDFTYHGPGQLVAYPVLDLAAWKKSIRWYLRALEDVLIQLLTSYGLDATRDPGLTGVWVNGAKIAAIGIGIHNWVTYHGIALNVNPELDHFNLIIPCGIADKPVTSMRALLAAPPTFDDVFLRFEQTFLDYFTAFESPPHCHSERT